MVKEINHLILQQFKNWMLPIAMLTGGIFYPFFSLLAPLTPYLIFLMLLVPYCKISVTHLRIRPLHYRLVLIQILGGLAVYGLLAGIQPDLAEGAFICVLAPTATSAAVITGMLGGSVTSLVTYTLLSNITVAALSPLIFSLIGENTAMPFLTSFGIICAEMIPLLIFPLITALLLQRFAPKVHRQIRERQQISFYLWAFSLTIVMGRTISFLVQQDPANYSIELLIALAALGVCGLQFLIGRALGHRYSNRIAGGQGLGQKNTVLAIWMAQTYLSPIASIGPASYVVWQNIVNSWQLWRKRRHEEQ